MSFNRLFYRCFTIVLLFSGYAAAAQGDVPQLGKSPIPEVIKAMRLEEKVKLVVGAGFNMPGLTPSGTGVGQTQDRVPGAAGTTHAIPRLGIPSLVTSDGPAGVRIDSTRKDQPGNLLCDGVAGRYAAGLHLGYGGGEKCGHCLWV